MSIEKEIKSKFRSEGHKAVVNIILTSNWVLEKQKRHFERGSLTAQQYNILRIYYCNFFSYLCHTMSRRVMLARELISREFLHTKVVLFLSLCSARISVINLLIRLFQTKIS